jgi:hypothetical protein
VNTPRGTPCPKCGLGHFEVYNFVPDIKYGSREICIECPPQEHLHLSCNVCAYVVWDWTAEQRLEAANRAKLS